MLAGFDSQTGLDPLTAKELSDELKIPFGVTMNALDALEHAHILGEVIVDAEISEGLVPLISTDQLTVAQIVDALDSVGLRKILQLDASRFDQFEEHYTKVRKAMRDSSFNLLVKDIPLTSGNIEA